MTSEIEGVIRELLTQEFKVDGEGIRTEATFKELGLDSLDVVSFAMALEDRLQIEIPEKELDGIETYGDALQLLERKVGARA
ncbi:MAG: phosphopantetheine-binding protein [Actinomycetota bacterium]